MMKINKFTIKRIFIPIIILVVLGAAFIFVSSTLAAEITAIDCHGKIVVTKAIEWNNATPYDSKVFTICISGSGYPESCQEITSEQVRLGNDTLTWDYVPAGTYAVYEKDPGLEWSVTGGGDVTISYEGQVAEKTITNSIVALDYGDLPEAYNLTLLGENGPRHEVGVIFLGGPPDGSISTEDDGQPDNSANGDSFDDGVVPVGNWSESTGMLRVVVSGGDACLFAWMDYKNYNDESGSNGIFEDDELLLFNYPVGAGQIDIPISDFVYQIDPSAIQGSNAYSRIRLLPRQENGACAYGNGDPLDMLTGDYINGEVEDYFWPFQANSIRMVSFNANSIEMSPYLIVGVILLTLTSLSLLAWRHLRKVNVIS
jgi:hypothetical protein